MLFPFVWMLVGSVKPDVEIRQVPATFLPQAPTLDNFVQLFDRLDFPRYFANSVIVAGTVTAGNALFSSMIGYALAKLEFMGKRLLFGLVIGMLMVPHVVTFIPLFIMVSNLGLINTLPGLILPFLVTPLGVFLMRQFIGGIPDELLEAAMIDGAGHVRIFWSIVMPLCRPALATLCILTFLGSWNSFLWPLVAALSDDMYTLPVALSLFAVGQNGTQYGLLMAGAVVIIMPVLVLFIALQRYFVEGIAFTGIK